MGTVKRGLKGSAGEFIFGLRKNCSPAEMKESQVWVRLAETEVKTIALTRLSQTIMQFFIVYVVMTHLCEHVVRPFKHGYDEKNTKTFYSCHPLGWSFKKKHGKYINELDNFYDFAKASHISDSLSLSNSWMKHWSFMKCSVDLATPEDLHR